MALVATIGALSTFAALYRLGQTWGSTAAERQGPMPGDEIVPEPDGWTTHAITIDAPTDRVWPWIVQMGYHRGGWYTPEWVDRWIFRMSNPSADHILVGLQDVRIGDQIPDGPPGTAYFVVEQLSKPTRLVLHSTTHLPAQLKKWAWVDWTWSFALLPIDDGARTRLLLRVRLVGSAAARCLWHLVIVPCDFVMARSMLRGIKARAEACEPAAEMADAGCGA